MLVPLALLALAAGVSAKVTGCSCNGYQYTYTSIGGVVTTNDVLYRADTPSRPTTNPDGWCFIDGAMTPQFSERLQSSIGTGIPSNYVNATWALYECQQLGIATGQCASQIEQIFTRSLLGITGTSTRYITSCTYPKANFEPLGCDCRFVCNPGYVACGTECMDPSTQVCVSSVPAPKSRKRDLRCPVGFATCRNRWASGYECLDIMRDIEACGACPGDVGSKDCSALPGVSDVRCSDGKCDVRSCDRHHELVRGECVPKA